MNNLKPLYNSFVEDIPQVFTSDTLEASTGNDTELIEFFQPDLLIYPDRPHSLFMDLSYPT